MKKTYALLLLLATFGVYSQGVTIDTGTYTPTDLINSVLIDSPCLTATNVTASTGSDFGSTNGIGYFENFNPNFPFTRGIVLMTGDVTKVPSPNNAVLSDGTAAWPGDAELEANLLSQSGVTINSVNASSIQFEFIASNNSISFDFIFASEEYGTSQCNYSDAFAFLLQNVTTSGANTNIALVPPASANIPVSVATIRNSLYNDQCPSVNPSFFGSYNGSGFGPAINFNGQTVQMTATASGLIVGNTYRIKIVIADGGGNVGYDSAIFLKANSFNANANILGPDIALCSGDPLPTLQPTTALQPGTTYSWSKEGSGTFTPPQNGASLVLSNPGITPAPTVGINKYILTYTEPGCAPLTDEIIVEIFPALNVLNPLPPQAVCNTSAANYNFDLTRTTQVILTQNTTTTGDDLPADTVVNYYLTNAAAQLGAGGELPTTYNILASENNKTIYARITNPTTNCFTVRPFQLIIIAQPVIAAIPADITMCARSLTDQRNNFNVAAAISTILGAQDPNLYAVSFYTTQSAAINDGASIAVNGGNTNLQPNRNVWIRVRNISDPSCFVVSTTFFKLIITPLPSVDILPDVVVCTSYTLPALTEPGAKYFTATNGGGTERAAGYVQTTSTTLHVYNESGPCKANDSFKITIADLPAIAPATASHCTNFTLPSLPYGKYYTLPGGPTGGGTEVTSGTVLNTTTTLHIYFEDTINSCVEEHSFTITIIPFTALPDYENKFGCSTYTLTANTDGGAYYTGPNKTGLITTPMVYNTPGTYTVYAFKETGVAPNYCSSEKSFTITIGIGNITPPADVDSCSAYTLPALPVGKYYTGPNFGLPEIPAGTTIGSTQQIWYGIPGELCTANLSFTVSVNIAPLPTIPDAGPVCDVFYLPTIPNDGDYYTGPGGTGTKRPKGFPVTTVGTTTWYFYYKAPTGPCFVEEEFTVTINASPAIDARPVEVIRCNESYFLDALVNGAYYLQPGGPSVSPALPAGYEISSDETIYVYAGSPDPGNTCFQEYSIDVFIFNTQVNDVADQVGCDSFDLNTLPIVGPGDYYTAPGGPLGTGVKLTPPYPIYNTNTTLYVYAENNTRVPCFDEDSFTITIYPQPVIDPITTVEACAQYTLPAYNTFTTTPANAVAHYYELPGGPGVAGQVEKFPGDNISASTTIYVYADISATAVDVCPDEEPLVINISPLPVITPAVSNLAGCTSVTLPALTVGNYFEDAAHTIAVTDPVITTSKPIYVLAVSPTNPACTTSATFNVTIETPPVLDPILPIEACDSFPLPLHNTISVVPAGASIHYYTLPGGPSVAGQVERAPGYLVNASTTIYVWAETGSSTTIICDDEEPMTINISATPVLPVIAPVIYGCDSVTLPTMATAGYFSDAAHTTPLPSLTITAAGTTTVYRYDENPANPACNVSDSFVVEVTKYPVFDPAEIADVDACDSYSLPAPITPGATYWSGPNGTGTNYPVGTPFTTTTTVHLYAVAGPAGNTCATSEDIVIQVYNVPEPAAVSNCGPYTLPALSDPNAAYYSASGGSLPISTVTSTQIVYVYGTSTVSGCSDEYQFLVTINANAVANPVPASLTTVCDSDANVDDGIVSFDLDSLTPTILGAQDPAVYAVTYYPSMADANMGTNEIVPDGTTLGDTNINPVYVRVASGTSASCRDFDTIVITVIPTPHSDPLKGTICYDSNTGLVETLPIQSGYSASLYTFEWTDSTGTVVATTADFTPVAPGDYELVITAQGLTGCESDPIPVTVIESAKPASVTFETSGWFSDKQTITVNAVPFIGTGDNFVYSLDGQTPQSSNVFTNVTQAPHEVTVIDINGCGTAAVPIQVPMVISPKFFSPNGDGINDYWKITGLENQPDSKIYIFDRYGKLLTEIFLNSGDGWDGTANGQPLPGNDYWYVVKYTDSAGVKREYRSHFALIR